MSCTYKERKQHTRRHKKIFYVPEIIIHLDIFWNIAYILVTTVQEKFEKLEKERNKEKRQKKIRKIRGLKFVYKKRLNRRKRPDWMEIL